MQKNKYEYNNVNTEENSELKKCTKCELCKTKRKIVLGCGNKSSKIMLIGEAPGEQEDIQGIPFVGKAGMLLNNMLIAINIERNDVYITNILKCRPPNNRDPLHIEMSECSVYLMKEIESVNPKLIIAIGRISAQFLLNTSEGIGKLRSKIHAYRHGNIESKLIVTYHPAYLLRSPTEMRKSLDDLLLIKDCMNHL